MLAQLQESCDTLTTTVNDRHAILAQYIALWKNYNSSKDVVEATIEEVQNDVEELTERSGDPAVPPTIIVENAKVSVVCGVRRTLSYNGCEAKRCCDLFLN